jgi:hypothetical protein
METKLLTPQQIYAEMQKEWVKLLRVTAGNTVRVTRTWTPNEQGFQNSPVNSIGQALKVKEIRNDNIMLSNNYVYPYFVLETVTVPTTVSLTKGNTRTVEIDGTTVNCGCVHLTTANAKKAIKAFEDVNSIMQNSSNNSIKFEFRIEETIIGANEISDLKGLVGV